MWTTPPGSAVDAVREKETVFPGLTLNLALSAGVGDVQVTLAESARPAEATRSKARAEAASAATNDRASDGNCAFFTILGSE
jgi:hypothetical protein